MLSDFWPACGHRHLQLDAQGWLRPTDAWWRHWLARPELALVDESCAAERALHAALQAEPGRAVPLAELKAVTDDDARQNMRLFLALRDGLLAAGTLEAFYIGLFRQGAITLPPLFIDLLAQAILRQLLDDESDALQARAAEMLFRPQRVSLQQGRVLAGDREALDRLNDGGGFGDLGRLLAEAGAPLRAAQLQVLGTDNATDYWQGGDRHRFVLDLTPTVNTELAHGLQVPLNLAHSGLNALSRVLERWVKHLLGVQVRIRPLQRVDDPAWRWHLGLDAEANALLNALYRDGQLPAGGEARLISLFRLDFADAAEMRADLAGVPVYLGLAMTEAGLLRIKPQNLLTNLPLRRAS